MPSKKRPHWLPLSGAYSKLCMLSPVASDALRSAVQSGEVPILGKRVEEHSRWPSTVNSKIDGKEIDWTNSMSSSIWENTLMLKSGALYFYVQVEWTRLEGYLRDILAIEVSKKTRPGDASVRKAFEESVRRYTEIGKIPTRKEHFAEMQGEFPGITDEQYKAVRAKHAPESWKKEGPRKD
jgi:hypothetical protein